MQTKNVVSIVQKGNKVKFVLVNKRDFAKEYTQKFKALMNSLELPTKEDK